MAHKLFAKHIYSSIWDIYVINTLFIKVTNYHGNVIFFSYTLKMCKYANLAL